jgi:hypothetical protein
VSSAGCLTTLSACGRGCKVSGRKRGCTIPPSVLRDPKTIRIPGVPGVPNTSLRAQPLCQPARLLRQIHPRHTPSTPSFCEQQDALKLCDNGILI